MEKIEFVDLKSQSEIIGDTILNAINGVISHGRFIMGPEIEALETKLADYTNAKYCITCSSGTDALLMALMTLGIGPGDAVFTTPFTFIATAEVVSLLGATPVFVDIEKDTFNIDPVLLEQAIEKVIKKETGRLNPKCIIPVDIFGLPADYQRINKIADKFDLMVIEDAAQSLGSSMGQQRAGNLADIAATSFFPAKPLGCYGDGGAVFTNDKDYFEKLISIRVHGKGSHKYDNARIGINGRLDTLQAAVLIEKLNIFQSEIEKRNNIAKIYATELADLVQVQKIPHGYSSAWAQFSFLSDKREKIIQVLKQRSIPHAIYYPKPLHLQPAFLCLDYKIGDFIVAETVSTNILSIPMHPYLADAQIDYIICAVKDAVI